MKAIKSVAVVGAAAGLLAAGAGVAVAHDGDNEQVENDGVRGVAVGSPGVGSGNLTQFVDTIQTNACGNTTSEIGSILNPAFGNNCSNS
jgi:ChpA-C